MKRKILIEPDIDDYQAVTFYRIRFEDEENSEFDKFYNKFDGDDFFEDDFNIIIEWLDRLADKGALMRYFRNAGGSLKEIPLETNKLRLYCFRVSECIVILGNGGRKTTIAYQDDPELNKYVSDLRESGRKLMSRLKHSDKASIYKCKLYGNLEFEIETT